jgi:hypothetical protein
MVRARQSFPAPEVRDVAGALREELRRPSIAGRVRGKRRIAVAVGSRGVAQIALIVRVLVEELRALGAEPFIVPGMGATGAPPRKGRRGSWPTWG